MAIEINRRVGSRVRGLAAERRLTQAALADRIGISHMAMSRRISGSTPFAPNELSEIAQILDVPIDVIFADRLVSSSERPVEYAEQFDSAASARGAV